MIDVNALKFDQNGLIPAICQDRQTGEVLVRLNEPIDHDKAKMIVASGVKSASDLSDNAMLAYKSMWDHITKDTDKKTQKRKYGGVGALILRCEDGSKLVFKQTGYTGENGGNR